jgi:hypothetical protein
MGSMGSMGSCIHLGQKNRRISKDPPKCYSLVFRYFHFGPYVDHLEEGTGFRNGVFDIPFNDDLVEVDQILQHYDLTLNFEYLHFKHPPSPRPPKRLAALVPRRASPSWLSRLGDPQMELG